MNTTLINYLSIVNLYYLVFLGGIPIIKSVKEERLNRRDFLREGFLSIVREASKLVGEILPLREDIPEPRFLRPPGALGEGRFKKLCNACQECVKVCPHQAIMMVGKKRRLPAIVPRKTPCYFCENFPCIESCPTGALSKKKIKMGVALLDPKRCLPYQQVFCIQCYNRCPVRAIKLDKEGRSWVTDKCTGCGVCEFLCPTNPPAIQVKPL